MSYGIIVNGLRRLAKELEDAQMKESMAEELEAAMESEKGKKKVKKVDADEASEDESDDGAEE